MAKPKPRRNQKGDDPDTGAVDALLARHSPEVLALVDALRTVVREAAPLAAEAPRTGWHALAYSDADVGYFCGIFPRESYVDLIIEWGVLLEDPDGLFTARGAQVGAIRLAPGQAWDRAAVIRLLHAALNLPTQRALRATLARERSR